jgi:hypothetical protein
MTQEAKKLRNTSAILESHGACWPYLGKAATHSFFEHEHLCVGLRGFASLLGHCQPTGVLEIHAITPGLV